MYNKEVKKQLTMSLISDELGQASTKKKEFLEIMEKLIPMVGMGRDRAAALLQRRARQ